MQLSQEAINEFKAIYHEEFGEVLTDADALDAALRVLRFFKAMMECQSREVIHSTLTDPQQTVQGCGTSVDNSSLAL